MAARDRRHLDDYELADDGSYVYRGAYWRWSRPKERTTLLRNAWVLLGASFACILGAGCVPLGTGIAVLAIVPYGICWILFAFAVARLWGLTREGERLRAHVYETTFERLGVLVPAAAVAAFASAVGAVASPFLDMLGWKAAIPFATLMVGSGVFLSQLRRHLEGISFTNDA